MPTPVDLVRDEVGFAGMRAGQPHAVERVYSHAEDRAINRLLGVEVEPEHHGVARAHAFDRLTRRVQEFDLLDPPLARSPARPVLTVGLALFVDLTEILVA